MAQGTGKKGGMAGLGVFGALVALLLKSKVALFSLLKFGWLVKSFSALFFSFGFYAMNMGWQGALVLIALIYVHEMGHFIFMKYKGLQPDAPAFVPFLGAYVAMKKLPEDPVTHAWVGYAGPFVGGLVSVALYQAALQLRSLPLVMAAHMGLILNLLQLVPVRPFDGGFIADCISKWLSIPGLLLLGWLVLRSPSLLMVGIFVLALFVTYRRLRDGSPYDALKVPITTKGIVLLAYASLVWLLWGQGLSAEQLIATLSNK